MLILRAVEERGLYNHPGAAFSWNLAPLCRRLFNSLQLPIIAAAPIEGRWLKQRMYESLPL